MSRSEALEEYTLALKQGQKEYNELIQAGKPANPAVLDELLPASSFEVVQDLGTVDIPSERIIGTKTAGRIAAFTPSFRPLMAADTEFASKWVSLCMAHLGDEGIRDPISCYEYLGDFYVQEGNKRVSVLRHFGAARIPAAVKRIVPPRTDDPRIVAYYEFMEFFRSSGLYTVQFRRPSDYARLLAALGREPGERWTEDDRRSFNARYHYFTDAFESLKERAAGMLPEEVLLLWLELYPFDDLGALSTSELKKRLTALIEDVNKADPAEPVPVKTSIDEEKASLLDRIVAPAPQHLNVAFVHQLNPVSSGWALGHDEGKTQMIRELGDKISVKSYYNADNTDKADDALRRAVADGAQVVFTTTPLLHKAALKAALENPKVRFYNCSVDQPYSSVRTYYGRVYEGKFITGAIAGAMAQNNRIGYVASYPIHGVTASINAFALGAQLTNPRAQIELRWSCVEGTPVKDFFDDGIRVISNRDTPVKSELYLDFCNYGTYYLTDAGEMVPLASPVWLWGEFYTSTVKKILAGTLKNDRASGPMNYWLGMDSGVISVELSERVPQGLRTLAEILLGGLRERKIDPFRRRIVAQDGSVKNDGTGTLSPEELLHMDWLCGNVIGSLPEYEEILPMSRALVRELGLYGKEIPVQKEGRPVEDSDRL